MNEMRWSSLDAQHCRLRLPAGEGYALAFVAIEPGRQRGGLAGGVMALLALLARATGAEILIGLEALYDLDPFREEP